MKDNPMTEAKAKSLGFVPKTNYYQNFQKDLLESMYKDIQSRNPEAMILVGKGGKKIIYVKASKEKPRYSPARADRGEYPTPRQVIGAVSRK